MSWEVVPGTPCINALGRYLDALPYRQRRDTLVLADDHFDRIRNELGGTGDAVDLHCRWGKVRLLPSVFGDVPR